MLQTNKIYNECCLETMNKMSDGFVDLVVTSPPYSNLRDYKTYTWSFDAIAKELFRVVKKGGVVVWVVGDKTKNGCEELAPFTQALFFKSIGFCVETMIYAKKSSPYPANVRYNQIFEFMFVLSKGIPKTFNPIKEQKKYYKDNPRTKSYRNKDGSITKAGSDKRILDRLLRAKKETMKVKGNIWTYSTGYMLSTMDKIAFKHPAIFPDALAKDHILSWSNENDLVYDPFAGSGTTLKMAKSLNRVYIGSEISKEFCEIIEQRI